MARNIDQSTRTARRALLLAAYDEQLREDAEVSFAVSVSRDGPLLRAVSDDGAGFVSYRSLAGYDGAGEGEQLDHLIARTIAFFEDQTIVGTFEWKTRSHDLPADLGARLRAHGLVAEPMESVMVGEASLLALACPLPAGVTLRRIGFDADGTRQSEPQIRSDIERMLETQRLVFASPGHNTVDSLYAGVTDHADLVELWVAVAADPTSRQEIVVTTGRLELVPNTQFAGIWGGATRPEWRHQGIYRALTAARARAALGKGTRYIYSDSTGYSRPILERSGFLQVTSTTPFVWTRAH